jgi:hypothetical protein
MELFQTDFSMLIVGKPQSGKSTLIENYLTNYWISQFKHIIIVNPNENYTESNLSLCEWIKHTKEQKKQYKEGKIDHISKIKLPFIEKWEDLKQIQEILDKYNAIEQKHPPIDDAVFDKHYQEQLEKLIIVENSEHINRVQDRLKHTIVSRPRTLFVFDNVIQNKHNRTLIEKLIMIGRHINVSVVLTSCYLTGIPIQIRSSIGIIALFFTTGREKAKIIEEFLIDPDILDEIYAKPFSVLIVDNRQPKPKVILTTSK